jgi:hypothetical protein
MMKLIHLLVALLLATVSASSFAQPLRVRGEIEKLDNSVLTVKASDATVFNVKLDDAAQVTAMAAASLADITVGKFVGTAARPGPNGQLVALEVHIFPESMRGTGEGHRPMDHENTMTNATVNKVVTAVHDRVLTLHYKGGEQQVQIPDGVPIVMLSPSNRGALKPGEHVSIRAIKQPDGSISTTRVTVGLNGLVPPL